MCVCASVCCKLRDLLEIKSEIAFINELIVYRNDKRHWFHKNVAELYWNIQVSVDLLWIIECFLKMVGVCYLATIIIYITTTISFTSLTKTTKTQYCPEVCTCLGFYVDCSGKSLKSVPWNAPTWATHLWALLCLLFIIYWHFSNYLAIFIYW